MSRRLDLLRSLVRQAGDRVGERAVGSLRRALSQAGKGQVHISERTLTSTVAHAASIRSASVSCDAGAIRVDALTDSARLQAAFVPLKPRFAPRGAKELSFRVDPPEAAAHPLASAVGGALAVAVARALWGALLPKIEGPPTAITDRDGDVLHVDLRSVPEVRALVGKGRMGLLTDVLELGAVEAHAGELRLTIRLPAPLRGP